MDENFNAESSDSEKEQTVPYSRIKEMADQKKELAEQLRIERMQREFMQQQLQAQQAPKDPEPNFDFEDESVKKYIDYQLKKETSEIKKQNDILRYKLELNEVVSRDPDLKGLEKDVDQYCVQYFQQTGTPIRIEAAAEIVKAKNAEKIAKRKTKKPSESMENIQQMATQATQPKAPVTSGGSVYTSPTKTSKDLDDIPF